MSKTTAIIVTAGKGKRFAQYNDGKEVKKNYTDLMGLPIVARTIKAFNDNSSVDSIVAVVGAGDIDNFKSEVVEKYGFNKIENIVEGGAERRDSVRNGFQAISNDTDFILIHDGGRPLVTGDIIERVVEETKKSGASAPGVKVKDTIKEVEGTKIVKTIPRETLVAIQTPQGFKVSLLKEAYEKIGNSLEATDECMVMEEAGFTVTVVEGSYENIKVTTPEDMPMAEAIIKKREK